MSVLPPPPDSAGTDKPPVRTELGSEAQVSAEDQFRLALHEKQPSQSGAAPPLPSFEQMAKKEPLPPLQNEIPAGQRSQLEAAVLERTKQLNRLFEDQVKKQYDAMRREVSKLAKAHQKDVQALDARFKSKMAGLASRFKQLEEEEAQVRLVKQENEDLQQEIERLVKLMEEQDRRNDASLATIAERDTTITTLSEQIVRLKEQQQQMQLEMEQRMRQANAAQAELESTVEGLQKTISKKKADLKEMQQRLVNVKNTYDTEVIRKQAEVSELEGSMRQLQRYTQQMSSFTSQVQGQIMTREQDMKVQLGLMKNTIAFALYIDETLQVDLTDPHSTTLLTRPVTVFPSGVTYSSETVEKLQEEAKRRGTVAKCPQTGEEITGTAPNHVVESVLSRYLFKQQITKDVMHALNEYQTKTPAGEEDQPLELYLQRMKASMVERLEGMHNEAMQKSQFSYQQQLELKAMESESRGKEGAATKAELEELRTEYNEHKKQALQDAAAFEDQIDELRARAKEAEEETEALKAKREELLHRVTRLTAKLARLEEGAEDDADSLEEPSSSVALNRVRKADLLQMRAELEQHNESMEELKKRLEERDAEIQALKDELAGLRKELAGEKRVTASLTEERDNLQKKVKALERESAATQSDLEKTRQSLEKVSESQKESNEAAKAANLQYKEANLKMEQLTKDADKLRACVPHPPPAPSAHPPASLALASLSLAPAHSASLSLSLRQLAGGSPRRRSSPATRRATMRSCRRRWRS